MKRRAAEAVLPDELFKPYEVQALTATGQTSAAGEASAGSEARASVQLPGEASYGTLSIGDLLGVVQAVYGEMTVRENRFAQRWAKIGLGSLAVAACVPMGLGMVNGNDWFALLMLPLATPFGVFMLTLDAESRYRPKGMRERRKAFKALCALSRERLTGELGADFSAEGFQALLEGRRAFAGDGREFKLRPAGVGSVKLLEVLTSTREIA